MNKEVYRVAPEAMSVIHKTMDLFLKGLATDTAKAAKEEKRVTLRYKDFASLVYGERPEDSKYEFLRPVFTRSAGPSEPTSAEASPLKAPAPMFGAAAGAGAAHPAPPKPAAPAKSIAD